MEFSQHKAEHVQKRTSQLRPVLGHFTGILGETC